MYNLAGRRSLGTKIRYRRTTDVHPLFFILDRAKKRVDVAGLCVRRISKCTGTAVSDVLPGPHHGGMRVHTLGDVRFLRARFGCNFFLVRRRRPLVVHSSLTVVCAHRTAAILYYARGPCLPFCGRQIFVRYDTAINNDNKQWERKQCVCARAPERIDDRTGCVSGIGVKSPPDPEERASSFRLFIGLFFFRHPNTCLNNILTPDTGRPFRMPPDPVSAARLRAFVRLSVIVSRRWGSDRRNRTTRVCRSEKKRTPREKNIRAA